MNTVEKLEGVRKEEEIYAGRFTAEQNRTREATWRVLCKEFLQRFVGRESTVLDIGAGEGEFLLNIEAKKKIALDLSDHVRKLASHGITVVQAPASDVDTQVSERVDVVFMSNFLEHLPNKALLLEVFESVHRVLAPGGKLLILQPNIRYIGAAYWDYIDHHIALTEWSLVEALEVTGYEVKTLIPRFLPYTVKSKVGSIATSGPVERLVSIYLKLPFLWRFFGKQTFVEAVKRS